MNFDEDFFRVNPGIKSLYAFLKKYDIEKFFLTKNFEIVLMELNLDEQWEKIRGIVVEKSGINVLLAGYTGYDDEAFKYLLNLLFLRAKPVFLGILDHIIESFISNKNIDDFDYDELRQRLVDCGFESVEIEKMEIWELESTIKKKEVRIKEVDNLALGTLNNLETSLIHKIYEEIIANPTSYHKESRSITSQRKKAVKMRDDLTCQICNEEFEEDELEVDHILPYSAGGSNEEYNLMVLCEECNGNKSARLDYYRSKEGKFKLMENIKVFVTANPNMCFNQ